MKIAGIPRGVVLNAVAAAVSVSLTAHARDAVTYLEYVASTGTTYRTGSFVHLSDVKPEGNWKIAVDFSLDGIGSSQSIFTCKRDDGGGRLICLYNIKDSGLRVDVNDVKGDAANGGLATGKFPTAGLRQTAVYDAGDLYLDGIKVASFKNGVESVTGENVNPITIFCDKKNLSEWTNYSKGRLYRVKMWNGAGALVHDLRPCMTAAGATGLYDALSDTVHTSASATAFTAGPVATPDGVEFLEYVQTKENSNNSHGQYFNTEYVPAYDCKIEMDLTLLSVPTDRTVTFFRANRGSNYTYLTLFGITATSDLTQSGLRLDMGKTDTSVEGYTGQTFVGAAPMQNKRRTYVYDKGVLSVDGKILQDNSALLNATELANAPNLPLTIGASYNNGNTPVGGTMANFGAFRFYRVRIWDGSGKLQRDLRPAKDAAGTVALYDTVNRKFHYHMYRPLNATGAATFGEVTGGGDAMFAVGPELDYLQTQGPSTGSPSTGKQWYDTGYIPTGSAKMEMDAKPLQATTDTYAWFTANNAASGSGGNRLNVFSIGNKGLRLDIAGDNKTYPASAVSPSKDVRETVRYNAGRLYYGNTEVTDRSTEAVAMGSAGWRTYLCINGQGSGSANSYNYAKMELYGFKMWNADGGTLVRDFVPRRTASGFVGLYDKVGDKFYRSGNDVVTAGKDVSAIAGTDNAPTPADIEAAGDVVDSVLLARAGARIAGGFAQKVEECVTCPFAGTTRTAYCAYFPQSFAVAADGEGTNVVTATTGFVSLGKPFSSAEGASWTAVLRVRREARDVDVEETVLSLGSDCAKDGVKIGFCGSEANRRLDVRVGDEVWPELSGFAAPAGDWLDIAVAVDAANSTVRVYYCREGGSVIWAGKTFDASAGSDSIVNLSARQAWEAKVGGEASVTNAEVGRMADGKWMMFDDALKAFKGSVENVALWSRKLSDAEVLAAFKALPRSAGMIVIVK